VSGGWLTGRWQLARKVMEFLVAAEVLMKS
jgi:hypothetical protein